MHRRAYYLMGIASIIALWSAPVAFALDSDGDGVDDAFDLCCNTPPGTLVDTDGRPIGDFDLDCDNDLADYAIYTQGFTGPLSGASACTCVSHIDCDDGNDCTIDTCVTGSCQYTNEGAGAGCDDGNLCTDFDACDGFGSCAGLPVDCSSLNTVCTAGTCNPTTGACEISVFPDGTACSDGDPCTTGDQCLGGTCTSVPFTCDDGNECTLDECNLGGCEFTPIIGLACDDGINCTIADACNASGICQGFLIDCSGFDTQCAAGACVEATGACDVVPVNEGAGCDDGDVNTVGDMCVNGECIGTIP